MMKRFMPLVLSFVMIITLIPFTVSAKNLPVTDEGMFLITSEGSVYGLTEEGKKLTELVIPAAVRGISVKKIEETALLSNENLKFIFIPKCVEELGDGLFYGCGNLEEIAVSTLNPYYEEEDGVLFTKGKQKLIASVKNRQGEYIIPDSVTEIAKYAFKDCRNLSRIVIPEGIHVIRQGTFEGCDSLDRLVLPKSLASIEHMAFSDCPELTEIQIPENVKEIDSTVFLQCENLRGILTAEGNPYYTSENGVLFTKNKQMLVTYPAGGMKEYVIPDSVTSIGEYAFSHCEKLSSVILPEGVKEIGFRAFDGCVSLEKIRIPEGVTLLPANLFYDCRKLTSVTIPESVVRIQGYVFEGCESLAELYIPAGVKYLGSGMFLSCPALRKIVYGGTKEQWEEAMKTAMHEGEGLGMSPEVQVIFQNTERPKVLSLNRSKITLYTENKLHRYTLILKYGDGRIHPSRIRWTSDRPSVVSVTKTGKMTGKKKGKAIVTASFRGKAYRCRVTVRKPSFKVTPVKMKLKKGKSMYISQDASPTADLTYKSLNKRIATVTKLGRVKARRKGKTKIRVTCNKMTRYVEVRVR